MKLIDLTHTFGEKMPVYPGDPLPELIQNAHIEKDGYNDYLIKTVMHVGTHIDAPLHMIAGGRKLSEIEIEKFIGNGVLIDARGKKSIEADLLNGITITRDNIVLVMTGSYKKFRDSEYYQSYPEISESFARRLIEFRVKIIGLDTPSPDRPPFAIHKLLLGKEILIIENLTNLEALLDVPKFEIFALPAKFEAEAAPVRVIAKI